MIIKRNGSLLTTATLNPNNVWSGSAFEYLKGPAIVSINLQSVTTFTLAGLLSACYIGASLIAEEYIVPNMDPAVYGLSSGLLSDNFYLQAGGMGGDRIVNTLRNPTAGTVAYDAIALVTPMNGNGRR